MGNGINDNWASFRSVGLSSDGNTNTLISTYAWDPFGTNNIIYYSFPQNTATYGSYYIGQGSASEFQTWRNLNSGQMNAVRLALAEWTKVANIRFQEVDDNASQAGDLRFAITSKYRENAAAWAYYPANSEEGGDVWFHSTYMSGDYTLGSFAFETVLHEIGHALGLKHPHDSPRIMPSTLDSTQFTVMSYNRSANSGTYAGTPMWYDIAALQYIYGANTTTTAGNDTYLVGNYDMTIWDAGGTDTLSFRNFSTAATIDLRPNNWNSVGSTTVMIYTNVQIENAEGGSGNDTIQGSDTANVLTGGAGNDIIRGGGGTDTVVFSGSRQQYSTQMDSDGVTLRVSGLDGTDLIREVEQFRFTDRTYNYSELVSTAPSASASTVYRFYNTLNNTHFYTASTVERDSIINTLTNFRYEGGAFKEDDSSGSTSVYRFLNRSTGSHFFTISTTERDYIRANLSVNYSYEGAAYSARTSQTTSGIPLYRFFNRSTGAHFFTVSDVEMNYVRSNLTQFSYEGVAYYVQSGGATATQPPSGPAGTMPAGTMPAGTMVDAGTRQEEEARWVAMNLAPLLDARGTSGSADSGSGQNPGCGCSECVAEAQGRLAFGNSNPAGRLSRGLSVFDSGSGSRYADGMLA